MSSTTRRRHKSILSTREWLTFRRNSRFEPSRSSQSPDTSRSCCWILGVDLASLATFWERKAICGLVWTFLEPCLAWRQSVKLKVMWSTRTWVMVLASGLEPSMERSRSRPFSGFAPPSKRYRTHIEGWANSFRHFTHALSRVRDVPSNSIRAHQSKLRWSLQPQWKMASLEVLSLTFPILRRQKSTFYSWWRDIRRK